VKEVAERGLGGGNVGFDRATNDTTNWYREKKFQSMICTEDVIK